ncbi:hypothetical protein BU200_04835 [Streptococcus acidominimus]|nr:hypothetical protein BU200_04835 [Streptococcus acidominimus]
MEATGKSFSSVKKWRLKVEELSGHEFKKTRMRVSRRRVQDIYQFTKEEFDKFVKLSKRIDETNNLSQSVVAIWGDLKARRERQLYRDVYTLKNTVNELIKANKGKDITVSVLTSSLKRLEERLETLEENQGKGFFSKIKKKKEVNING